MNKRIINKISLLILFCLFLPSFGYATTLYVDATPGENCAGDYSISNRSCSGSDGSSYTTIIAGLNAASDGDTIYIRSGDYEEIYNTWFNKTNITIQGYTGETINWTYLTSVVREAFLPSGTMDGLIVRNIKFKGLSSELLNSGNFTFSDVGSNIYYIDTEPTRAAKFQKSSEGTWSQIKRASVDCGYACTNAQCEAALSDESDGAYCEAYLSGNRNYIKSTSGNPATRNDLRMIGVGKIIGRDSSTDSYTFTIEDCEFEGAGHAILKGNNRWIIRRCSFKDFGHTYNDHAMYIWGDHSAGSETIIENCYFENTSTSGNLHIYYGGAGFIARNNIFRNVAQGNGLMYVYTTDNVKLYNNTFYGQGRILVSTNDAEGGDNLEIKNNIFQNGGDSYDIDFMNSSTSNATTVSYNLTDKNDIDGYETNLTNYTKSNNTLSTNASFASSSPTQWTSFALDTGSQAINSGTNLGNTHDGCLSSLDTTWPPTALDQDNFGAWEIGAFCYTPLTTVTGVTVSGSGSWQ